jgi:hypothetical protein
LLIGKSEGRSGRDNNNTQYTTYCIEQTLLWRHITLHYNVKMQFIVYRVNQCARLA